ncbi:hypothetical protein DRR46_19140, partial [Escherichia coli]|nr:hypothetical protein [Escherichia coli]
MWGNKPPLPCLPRLEKTRQRRTRHFFHQRKKAMWGNKPPLPCLPRLEKTRQRRTRHFFHQRKKAIVTDGLSL